jgi:hypothetical protein
MKKWMTAAMAALLALPAMAQEDALKDLPGYIGFGELSSVYGEPKVMINIGGTILRFVGAAAKDNPEAQAIFSQLKGVRINVYNTDGNPAAALEQVKQVKGLLQSKQWEPIVQVNEDGEQAQIYLRINGDRMEGLTVMAVNDEEAVFINIIGQLDPEQLGAVMNSFDIDIDQHLEVD